MQPRIMTGWLTADANDAWTTPKEGEPSTRKLSFDVHDKDACTGIEYSERCVIEGKDAIEYYEPLLLAGAGVIVQGESGAMHWHKRGLSSPVVLKFIRTTKVEFTRRIKREAPVEKKEEVVA